jgi:hypothetical protein
MRQRSGSPAPTSIISVISWAIVALVIVWITLAAVLGLFTPVFAAAGP